MLNINMDVDPNLESTLDNHFDKRIKMIPINKIVPNSLNNDFDTEEEIKIFAEEIYDQGGVREPWHVYRDEDRNKYVLLGGHKRYYACLVNIAKYKDAQHIVPVIIESRPSDWVAETLFIEELNQHRHYDDRKLLIRARGLYKVYDELVARNEKPAGEKREWFAKKLNCGIKKAERFIFIIEGRYSENDTKLTKKPKFKNSPDARYEDVRVHMQRKLKTKVKITKSSISISFSDVDDFNRLLSIIGCEDVVNE